MSRFELFLSLNNGLLNEEEQSWLLSLCKNLTQAMQDAVVIPKAPNCLVLAAELDLKCLCMNYENLVCALVTDVTQFCCLTEASTFEQSAVKKRHNGSLGMQAMAKTTGLVPVSGQIHVYQWFTEIDMGLSTKA